MLGDGAHEDWCYYNLYIRNRFLSASLRACAAYNGLYALLRTKQRSHRMKQFLNETEDDGNGCSRSDCMNSNDGRSVEYT